MSNTIDDASIKEFYDGLFDVASKFMTSGSVHSPVLVVRHRSGVMPIDTSVLTDERAIDFIATAADPKVHAVALIVDVLYREDEAEAARVLVPAAGVERSAHFKALADHIQAIGLMARLRYEDAYDARRRRICRMPTRSANCARTLLEMKRWWSPS